MDHTKQARALRPFRGSERGAGILWALVSVAVMGGVVWSLSVLVEGRTKERTVESVRRTRDYIYRTIRASATQPSAILLSAQADAAMQKCVNALTTADCSHTSEATAKTFSLVVPLSYDATLQKTLLTTADLSDVQGAFDRFGNDNCPNNAECMLRGVTKFWLECPPAGMRCQTAGRLRIRIEVIKNPSYNPSADSLGLKSMALGSKNSKGGEDAVVSIPSIVSADLQRCPAGAHVVGIDDSGSVLCRCLLGPEQTGSVDNLNCPAVSCPNGKQLVGVEKVGGDATSAGTSQYKVKCKETQWDNNTCIDPPVSGDTRYFECPANNLMTGFYNPTCTIPLPSKVKELDALIDANPIITYKQVWKKKPKPGHWETVTKTEYCKRKEVDCWLPFVQIKCSGGGVRCCPRP